MTSHLVAASTCGEIQFYSIVPNGFDFSHSRSEVSNQRTKANNNCKKTLFKVMKQFYLARTAKRVHVCFHHVSPSCFSRGDKCLGEKRLNLRLFML